MNYLLLVYMDETAWFARSQQERDRVMAECTAYGKEITASGHLLGGSPLQPSSTATTLRLESEKTLITDGPFAETKEVLCGYHLVTCRDLDEAIAVGQRFPGLKAGLAIEVRPLMSV